MGVSASFRIEQHEIDEWNRLAWELRRKDIEQSVQLAEQAYQASQAGNYLLGLANSLTCIARFSHYNSEHSLSLSQSLEALEYFDQLGVQDRMYLANLHTLAMVYGALGGYSNALGTFLRIRGLAEQLDQDDFRVIALNGISISYSRNLNHMKALEYYQECLALCQSTQNHYMAGVVEHNLALEYGYLHDYPTALHHAMLSREIFENLHEEADLLGTLLAIGDIHGKMGNLDTALDVLTRVYHRIKNVPIYHQKYQLIVMFNLGKVYTAREEFTLAEEAFHTALHIAQTTSDKRYIYDSYFELAVMYKRQGNFERALASFEEYHRFKEEVFSTENIAAINNLIVLHQTESARQETEFYKQLREQDRLHFERMNQMKDDLLQTASHDLKSPLTSILTYAHLLHKDVQDSNPKTQNYVRVIENQVLMMRSMISEILDLAVWEAQPNTFALVNLSELATKITQETREIANQNQINLNTHIQSDIVARLYPEQIYRLLQNLLSNALKYSPIHSSVTLTVRQKVDTLYIMIEDTGYGIPAEDIPYIFEKFYRVRNDRNQNIEGSGLGLSIVKRIVDLHHGTIHVDSEIGRGTRFNIQLPLRK